MNLFSLFKKKPYLSLIFDIREFSLTVAVAKIIGSKKPQLLYCHNFNVQESDINVNKKYVPSLIKTIDKAIVETQRKIQKLGISEKIGEYLFFIGSPWSISKSKEVKLSKDKEFVINNELLKRFIVGGEKTNNSNWEILEERIIQSKLNGYKIDNIYNRKTKELEIHLLTSFINKELKDKINYFLENKIGKRKKHQLYSQTVSSYTFTRDLFSNKNNYIFVNIGKLITDIYIVINDIIYGISSFPYGENKIIETIAKKSGQTKEMIASLINISAHGNFESAKEKEAKALLRSGIDEWSAKFNDVLKNICDKNQVPTNIFMIDNSVLTNLFINTDGRGNIDCPITIFEEKPKITLIREGVMNSQILGGKTYPGESFIKMNLVFLKKING